MGVKDKIKIYFQFVQQKTSRLEKSKLKKKDKIFKICKNLNLN